MKKKFWLILLAVISVLCLAFVSACGRGNKEHVHKFTWAYNNDATCTEDGTETERCTCGETGETRTKTGTKLGHDIKLLPAKEATCSESGYSAHNACSRCGYTSDSNVTYTEALHVKYQLNEEGTAYIVESLDNSCTDQEIAIPRFYEGLPVTSIGEDAFYQCNGFESVTIPDSVTSIGGGAFWECRGLKAVHITDLTAWYKIDFSDWYANPLYYAEHLYLDGNEVKKLTIPSEIKMIKDYTFVGCIGLRGDLKIPDNVTSIGAYAFCNANIKSVEIPTSMTSIGNCTFIGCDELKEVNITDLTAWCGINFGSLESNPLFFARHLFLDSREIKNLTIPSEIKKIKDYAFSGCDGLTSIEIPDGVTMIGHAAFSHCSKLTSITIPDSVTSIGAEAFNYCSGLESVTIGSGVISIGSLAFNGCNGLKEVHITHLAAWCRIDFSDFYSNPLLYAYHMFLNSVEVKNLTIPSEINEIKDCAFAGYSGLTSVTIPDSVISIGNSAFQGCSGLTGELKIPDSVISIGGSAFYGCSGLTSITIPDGVTSIGSSAFSGCSGLTSITIPDSVTSIGYSAFYGCSGLTGMLRIPDSVTSIGERAFGGCSGLTSILIPDGVTSIEKSAFGGCSGLTSIEIPDSVTMIGEEAFAGTAYYNDDSNWENGTVLYIGNYLIEAKFNFGCLFHSR